MRKLLTIMLLACSALVACKTAPLPSTTRSAAPTHGIVPRVECDALLTDAGPIPAYPVLASGASATDYARAQQLWAIRAVRIIDDERAGRRAAVECFARLRAVGLIH
ncbi:gp25 [Burkholderia phage Bcep43]|uniref:Gp25 n=2 Tax=Naesvirus TaxID=2733115 RepID=Q6UKC6_9CAUD|nr:gp25 [Burkholderia phage Bcep781]NP_958130.2 gp25 [Burkholderia phage Bcep43]AAN38026.2 gp25 [Burkholderia phage Bcep781]AAR89316.2 gp25 [Burkholderia phage Bcep43]